MSTECAANITYIQQFKVASLAKNVLLVPEPLFLDARVGYEHTSYTISEQTSTEEICLISLSPEIDLNFSINITTDTTPSKISPVFFCYPYTIKSQI